jgi:hypothetical protein
MVCGCHRPTVHPQYRDAAGRSVTAEGRGGLELPWQQFAGLRGHREEVGPPIRPGHLGPSELEPFEQGMGLEVLVTEQHQAIVAPMEPRVFSKNTRVAQRLVVPNPPPSVGQTTGQERVAGELIVGVGEDLPEVALDRRQRRFGRCDVGHGRLGLGPLFGGAAPRRVQDDGELRLVEADGGRQPDLQGLLAEVAEPADEQSVPSFEQNRTERRVDLKAPVIELRDRSAGDLGEFVERHEDPLSDPDHVEGADLLSSNHHSHQQLLALVGQRRVVRERQNRGMGRARNRQAKNQRGNDGKPPPPNDSVLSDPHPNPHPHPPHPWRRPESASEQVARVRRIARPPRWWCP